MLKHFPMEIISKTENLETEYRRFLPATPTNFVQLCLVSFLFSTSMCLSLTLQCPRLRHPAIVLVSSQVPPLLTHKIYLTCLHSGSGISSLTPTFLASMTDFLVKLTPQQSSLGYTSGLSLLCYTSHVFLSYSSQASFLKCQLS